MAVAIREERVPCLDNKMGDDALTDQTLRVPVEALPERPASPVALGWKEGGKARVPTATLEEDGDVEKNCTTALGR